MHKLDVLEPFRPIALNEEGCCVIRILKQAWPHSPSLDKRVLEEVCSVFDGIAGAPQERSLLRRLVEGDPIQRRIDELSMKMLGLGDRIREIDAIREAVAVELKVLDEILAASSRAEKRKERRKRKRGEESTYQRSLTEYL